MAVMTVAVLRRPDTGWEHRRTKRGLSVCTLAQTGLPRVASRSAARVSVLSAVVAGGCSSNRVPA
ncbi:hypothetical protein ACOT8G_32645 [Streptomyces sp. NY05-11A]